MFTITGKKAGIVWDAEHNKPLIKFVDGKAETADATVAEKLRALGYTVEGGNAPSLLEMTVAELKAYASEKNIDLGEATKKKEIITKIQEAE